jgi:hypothetical protein
MYAIAITQMFHFFFVLNPLRIRFGVISDSFCLDVEPNQDNNQWLFQNGMIKLKSNPTLCMSGTSPGNFSMFPWTVLAYCNSSDPSQQFQFVNSTVYPFASIFQNDYILSTENSDTDPDTAVNFIAVTATFINNCNSNDPNQQIQFTGSSSVPGQLQAANNKCISGMSRLVYFTIMNDAQLMLLLYPSAACNDHTNGCMPLPLVPCNANDTSQLFTYTSYNSSFENVANGLCLDVWNDEVS